ncbi:MAG: hypothetical protein MUQ00_14980 [Candidatus Aminicenantes bacterium]|nr:hypothetical protein [Candidatus Aminicenantes bacterium]
MLYHLDSLIAFVSVILLASLIVTALTQMAIALFNLRGRNLIWGLKRLVVQIEPSLAEDADAVVRKILTNPLIFSGGELKGFWARFRRLPSVVRREEFSHLLVKLAESKDVDEFGKEAVQGLRALAAVDPEELKKIKKQLDALPADWRAAVENELKKASVFAFDRFKAARLKIMELEAWFDRISDRMSQQFSRNSKIISVGLAVLVVVFFRLDSIQLLKRVYTDQELRARLVASVDQIRETGDAVLGGPTTYDMAFQALKGKVDDLKMPTQSILSRESAELWLQNNKPADMDYEELLSKYNLDLSEATKNKLGALGDALKTTGDRLSMLSMEIFGKGHVFRGMVSSWQSVLGRIISIILLSLGAPFWFNMLKNLTNLRTRLMQNEEKERLKRQEDK